jgi:transcriptional regulator with PAS, ATPase and Fis domain
MRYNQFNAILNTEYNPPGGHAEVKLKIGIITNYEYSEEEKKSRADANPDCELIFVKGAMAGALPIGKWMEQDLHVDAVITSIATSRYLENELNIPIIPLYLKNYDIMKALCQGSKLGDRLAFVAIETREIRYDFDEITGLLGVNAIHYEFAGIENSPLVLDQAVKDGCDVVISMGNLTIPLARNRGLATVFISQNIHTFNEAVSEIRHIYEERSKEIRRSIWLSTIINSVNDGLLAWDSSGKITLFNDAARGIFQIEATDIVGRGADAFTARVPELSGLLSLDSEYKVLTLGENEYIARAFSCHDGQAPLGSFMLVNEVKRIQCMEMFVRRKKSETGFVSLNHFADIKGNSRCIEEIKNTAKRYALSDVNIMIYGESGSGKELFAQSIHNYSHFKDGPFVAVNCTALTDSLLESELFGYEEGTFTGAKKGGKAGLFELAHGGTLFLDEIGDISLSLQAKLLRVLQERMIRRIGGDKYIPLQIRLIFATNRDLCKEVQNKNFREDLYYRINVLTLHIPPLRDRREDILPLAKDISFRICKRMGIPYFFPERCDEILQQYHWPGNIRELHNFMERLIVLQIKDSALIGQMLSISRQAPAGALNQPAPATDSHIHVAIGPLREMEAEIIRTLYNRYHGDKKQVERVLDVSATTLWRRFKTMKLT